MTLLEAALRRVAEDLKAAGPEDLERARSALTRIRELGFNRNQDLLGGLDELLAE